LQDQGFDFFARCGPILSTGIASTLDTLRGRLPDPTPTKITKPSLGRSADGAYDFHHIEKAIAGGANT
jgi:hypothetical protein